MPISDLNKAPTDPDALAEYLAIIARWGFEAEDFFAMFPEQKIIVSDSLPQRDKDWYKKLALAIVNGFQENKSGGAPTPKEAPTMTDQDQKEFLRLTRLLQEDIKRKIIKLLHTLSIPEKAWDSEDEHNSYAFGFRAAAWMFEDLLKEME